MDPLVRVIYSGLTQSVFRLDRVKFISCDCPEMIPVNLYSNASWFTSFSSGIISSEVAEVCPTLHLMLLLGPKSPPHLRTIQISYSSLRQLCPKSSSTNEKLFVTAFKDLYVSRLHKIQIVIPQAAHQALGICFHMREVYSSNIRLLL
jgi:hypothetical protein